MGGNFAWVCIRILEGGHFSIMFADADPRMTGLALSFIMDKLFIQAPKFMREVSTGSIWIGLLTISY